MENKYFGSISFNSGLNDFDNFGQNIKLNDVVKELSNGMSGVFVAPAGSGRTHFLKCVSQGLIENDVAHVFVDLKLVTGSNFILCKQQIEEIGDAERVVILLDGLEHIIQNDQPLHAILVGIEKKLKKPKLQFVLTCLPIDYLLSHPSQTISFFQRDDKVFTALATPLTIDEFESYIEGIPTHKWSTSPQPKLRKVLSWIQQQGLEEYCRWPKDIYWLKSIYDEYDSSNFIPLDNVHERWTRYELEYAYRQYNAFDLKEARRALDELCLASAFSNTAIDSLYGRYDFSITGFDLLIVLRSGLFNVNHQDIKPVLDTHSNYKDWCVANLFQRKLNEGMPEKFLFGFARVLVGEKEKLRAYSKGAMVYLSAKPEHQWLRKQMINDHPEAIIDMADPIKLSITERIEILKSLEISLQGPDDLGHRWIDYGLKRFFNNELEKFVTEQYKAAFEDDLSQNHAYLRLLTELFECAGSDALLIHVQEILPKLTNKMWRLERVIIEYLSRLGGNKYRQLLIDYVDYTPAQNHDEIRKYAGRLSIVAGETFQREMDIPSLLANIKKVIDVQTNESTGLDFFLGYSIWNRLPRHQEQEQIISGILAILTESDGGLNVRYRWLISALGEITLQYFRAHEAVDLSQPSGLVLKSYLKWYDRVLTNSGSGNSSLSMAIDDFFKLPKVKRAWVRHVFNKRNKDNFSFHWLSDAFFLHGGALTDTMNHNEQLAIEITEDADENEDFRLFSARNIQGIGELERLLSCELASVAVREAVKAQIEIRNKSIQDVANYVPERDNSREVKNEKQRNEDKQQKEQFIEALEESCDMVKSAEYIGYLWKLCGLDWNSVGYSNFSPKKIKEQFGKKWVEIARTGLINLLEKTELLPCKSDAINGENFYNTATMVHQAICLRNNDINDFSFDAVNNAVAAITWEFNSPPGWTNKLIRYHEADVKIILKEQLYNEAVSTEESNNPIHQFARYGDTELSRICLGIVIELIESKTYVNLGALVDASAVVARQVIDVTLFHRLHEMYEELSEPNAELIANIIAVSPADGLPILIKYCEEVEHKNFLIEVISSLIGRQASGSKLKRILTNASYIIDFVRIVISITSDNENRIDEGFVLVTPELEVNWFRRSLETRLSNLSYDVAKEFLFYLEQDQKLKSKIPGIASIENEVLDKEVNQPLSVNQIESWIGGHWAKNIRTVGQLHAHVTAILDDIHHHVLSNDFSAEPLWRGLVGEINKGQKDRTLEDHAQVWLANELRYRSNNIYNVKREDQSKNNKRRDITISIPAVGSCVIEMKVLNIKNGYPYNHLLNDTINIQMPQYISDEDHRAAILLLFSTNPSKRKLPDGTMGSVSDVAKWLEKDNLADTIKSLEKFTVYPFVIGDKEG